MREIKFRAWHKNAREFTFMDFDISDYRMGWKIEHDGSRDYRDFIFNQFTGLKDKNGKEIYEDDIVSFTRPVGNWTGRRMTTAHKIYFEEHICAFVLDSIWNYTKFRNAPFYVYEILGNIHENDFEKIKLAVEAVTPNEVQK